MGTSSHVVAAEIAAVLLELAGIVHLFWAMGGEAGKDAAIPSVDGIAVIRPRAPLTAAIGVILFAFAAYVLFIGGTWGTPPRIARLGGLVLVAVFVLRGVGDFRYVGLFKKIKDSPFARYDTRYYTPLCFLLAGLIGRVSVG